MKIVFFGDSLTWGGYGGNFVTEVQRLLPQHEFINAGHGGDTVVNLLERVERSVLAHEPDGVFVMIGGNDAISASQPETRNYYRRSKKILPDGVVDENRFNTAYRDLLTKLQLAHVLVWVGLEPNEYNPTVVAMHREYNQHAADIAQSMGIPVLDLMAALPGAPLKDRPPLSMQTIRVIGERENGVWSDYEAERDREGYTFSFDGLHLTPDAAKEVAQHIVAFLDLPQEG